MKGLKFLLLFVLVICTTIGLTACGKDNGAKEEHNAEIYSIYQTYVAHAEEKGIEPKSYEDWLLSIKGEKGDNGKDGNTPYIGENGNWWINNSDTGVCATVKSSLEDVEDGTEIKLVKQQKLPLSFDVKNGKVVLNEVNVSIYNFNDVPSIYSRGIYLYKTKIEVSGKYEGKNLDNNEYLAPSIIFYGDCGIAESAEYYCQDITKFTIDNNNFNLSGWIYTPSIVKYFSIYDVSIYDNYTIKYTDYSIKVVDANKNGIEGVGVQLSKELVDKNSPSVSQRASKSSIYTTDTNGNTIIRYDMKDEMYVIISSVPNGYILPKEPIKLEKGQTKVEIKLDGNAFAYEQVVAMFRTRNPLYTSFSFQIGDSMTNIEWFENDKEMVVQVPCYYLTNNEVTYEIYYKNKVNNKTFYIDQSRNLLINCEEQNFMLSQFVYADGEEKSETVEIENKNYDCISITSTNGNTIKFIKDNGELKCMQLCVESQIITYENLVVSNEIPVSSKLFGVKDYHESNEIMYRVLSNSMSPTLQHGGIYFFEPIKDISTLRVDDIILVWADLGMEEKVLNAHRIVEIVNNDGKTGFVLKGDNNPVNDSITYFSEDIVGVLATN